MKKFLIFVIVVVVGLYVSNQLYKAYRLHYLTNDRAVLFVYINIKPDEIEKYFNLDESQIQAVKESYHLRCVVPNHEHLHLINYKVNYDINTINCSQSYDFDTQLELKKAYVQNHTLRIELFGNDSRKIAYKDLSLPWDYGKVNHVVIEKDREYKHCSN